jgi:DeoR/GlpR family transcriptional regulator of sugar metabolism
MLKQERQAYILHQVNLHNKVLAVDLCQHINVSNDTIRRDLQELAEKGSIIKVHGGALSNSFHNGNFQSEPIYSHAKKQVIARKAVSLIKDGMFVLTGGGTTISEMARALPLDLTATFISGSLTALLEYSKHPNIDVISIGDKVSKGSKMSIGPDGVMKVRQFKSDLCFLGINAIDATHGISDNDWDVVQMKRAMIESSKLTVCLTISEKINSQQPIQVCDLSRVNVLITELPPDHPLLTPYAEAGITLI